MSDYWNAVLDAFAYSDYDWPTGIPVRLSIIYLIWFVIHEHMRIRRLREANLLPQ